MNVKRNIIEDCARLLKNILDRNPKKDYIEANIALIKGEVEGSKFLPTPVFGYKLPQTVIKLKAVGVFENVKKIYGFEKLQNTNQLEEVLSEALTVGVDELNKGRYYDGRIFDDSAWRPGMPTPKKEGWEGLYKVNLVSISARKWLKDGGFGDNLATYNEGLRKLTKQKISRQLKDLVKTCKLGEKEEKLLSILSNFEEHKTKDLDNQVPTKAHRKLKESLQKKLAGTGFHIITIKGSGLFPQPCYQLDYLTGTEVEN